MEVIRKHYNSFLGIVTVFFSVIAYLFILLTINKGTSCDEGYYLLSYLPNQPIHWGISQFEFIVRKIFWFLPEDNALILRYVRYFINIFSLAFFAFSSHKWLKKKYAVEFSPFQYYSLIFLSGVLSFGFASPILYYDNLQLFIYLLTFSLYFLHSTSDSLFQKILFLVISGLLMIFGVFNYLPSGLLLITAITFLLILEKKQVQNIFYLLLGLFFGLIIYHFLISDIHQTIRDIQSSFFTAQQGTTKHDNRHLILAVVKYLMEFAVFFLLFLVFGSLLGLTHKIKGIRLKYFIYALFTLIILGIVLQQGLFSKYYTDFFTIPVAMVFAYIILEKHNKNTIKISLKEILTFSLFLFIPLMGIFGTNQNLSAKMLFFMPFWVVAFYLLIAFSKTKENLFIKVSSTVYVLLLITGFAYLVYFNRFHYYYTPKKSNIEIENDVRFQHIKVSQWQKDFNEKAIRILNENGFKKGDKILAFYDNFITVYIAGGYIPKDLIYQFEVFATDIKNIPDKPVDYILIIEEQEKPMMEFLKKTGWEFPEKYQRFDLGKAAENLPAGYNSILFIKKK
ncbi:membrane hypothetical protein [uncultured Paludibacter sp.]|nr:membrane hypothetical protein [uncultured Paludibacter sp.]